jgi:lipopolysaccharide export LptBFGC system permease protein LptF
VVFGSPSSIVIDRWAATAYRTKMIGSDNSAPDRPHRSRLSVHWILPLTLVVLALLAAPFYTRVMENAMWMGQSMRALCGF